LFTESKLVKSFKIIYVVEKSEIFTVNTLLLG